MRRLVPEPLDAAEIEAAYADVADRRAEGRPYVVVNMVASVDGAIAVAGRTEGLSTPADRMVFHFLRSLADVILVGAQTVRAEHYGPPRLSEERQAARRARGQQPLPRIAVVSGRLALDWTSRLFADPPVRPLVIAPSEADPERLRQAEGVADVVRAGDASVDMGVALGDLHRLGADVLLCEGGPTLNGELAGRDLIDELCLTISASLVGGDVASGLVGRAPLPAQLPLTLAHVLEDELEGDLFLRYRRPGR